MRDTKKAFLTLKNRDIYCEQIRPKLVLVTWHQITWN